MAKHEKTVINYDKSYESNLIGLRGIIIFAVGLFLLVVITFGLMWFLQNIMEEQTAQTDKKNENPMKMEELERLPPEPRLQAAPGFGVDSPNGRVNLELKAPQSEYRELHKQWETLWENGQKDQKTGTVISLSMADAKKKLLEENVKAASSPDAQKIFEESSSIVSYSSAGRLASDRRK